MEKARIIDLPKIVDPRGNLTVAEQMKNVPFDIARVYWTYDVPSGERRGGHAHRTCEEIVIAVSGSFDVTVDDGCGHKEIYRIRGFISVLGCGARSRISLVEPSVSCWPLSCSTRTNTCMNTTNSWSL